ncbi:DUF86 domain-containing protein [bacterium]|nr:DUF86 domain-containing protein [bacterium]
MVNIEIIQKKIGKLKEHIAILEKIQKYSKDTFIKDPVIHGAAERYLQLAIESIFDVGNHIISDKNFRKPATYFDILFILKEEKILAEKTFEEAKGIAGFRNALVHDYLDLNLEIVYDVLMKKTDVLKKIIREYIELL